VRPLTAEKFFEALKAAGVVREEDLIRRIVIDIQAPVMVVMYIERFGDERLLDVIPTLDGIEIRTGPRAVIVSTPADDDQHPHTRRGGPVNVDLLRRAATLIRERAQAATPGPWDANGRWVWSRIRPEAVYGTAEPDDVAHIASWHPDVALAVADWLDYVAALLDVGSAGMLGTQLDLALAVAHAYLGEVTA